MLQKQAIILELESCCELSSQLCCHKTKLRPTLMSYWHLKNTMNDFSKALMLCFTIALGACSTAPKSPQHIDSHGVYSVEQTQTGLLAQHAPIVRIEDGERDYNKIGTVTAHKDDKGKERITIDTTQATFYTEQTKFTGTHGNYTNLIYRLHFSQVPFRTWPFSLTYGRNVGLFVIVTLNEQQQPVLFTTVHSCGCYLAFIPTNHLIDSAYPQVWPQGQQTHFGEKLPARLSMNNADNNRIIIDLRGSTHRVHDIIIKPNKNLSEDNNTTLVKLAAVDKLRALPLGDQTVSMFESTGWRKGYVKGSHKPFEALLMSWWALDPHIGVDKDYGPPEKTGTIFYTSLKPWNRKASNMWPFTEFLAFWGWSL